MDRLVEGGLVLAAVHEDGLGTEHLGDLGQDGRTALGDDPVGEHAQERVRRDAAEAVGAAALEADAEFRHRHVLALVLRAYGEDLAELLQAVFDFVVHLLGDEHPHAAFIDRAHQLAEGVQLVVLAAERDHQHTAGVGMMHHVGEDGAGILVVRPKLGAAVIVRESDDRIDTPLLSGDFRLEALHDGLADPVHTTHVGNDPDLVADAHLPVGAAEAFKRNRLLTSAD